MRATTGRIARCALLLLGVATCGAFAQTPPPEPAPAKPSEISAELREALRAKLQSSEPAEAAWGAWEARLWRATELVDELKAAMRRTVAEEDSPTRPFVLRAQLDALVQLGARFDAEEFAAVRKIGAVRTPALVVAARDPKVHAKEIESLRESARHEERIAVDNLLAVGAPDRATALLLPEARIELTIDVCDPDGYAGLGGSHNTSIGCGSMTAPPGFPPVALYECVVAPRTDDVVFADGPRPVAYRRIVRTESEFGLGHHASRVDPAEHALAMLRWIAKDSAAESLLEPTPRVRVVWTNADDYVADVRAELGRRTAAWNALLERLAAAGALARERFPSAAPIDLRIHDARRDRSVELPKLP